MLSWRSERRRVMEKTSSPLVSRQLQSKLLDRTPLMQENAEHEETLLNGSCCLGGGFLLGSSLLIVPTPVGVAHGNGLYTSCTSAHAVCDAPIRTPGFPLVRPAGGIIPHEFFTPETTPALRLLALSSPSSSHTSVLQSK